MATPLRYGVKLQKVYVRFPPAVYDELARTAVRWNLRDDAPGKWTAPRVCVELCAQALGVELPESAR